MKLKNVKYYCCEDLNLIEGYKEAMEDTSDTIYACHHRREIDDMLTKSELIEKGLYYDRPASELIILTREEHTKLHNTYDKNFIAKAHSKEQKIKSADAHRGKKNWCCKGEVICIETQKVYECAQIAEKELHIRHVGDACNGRRKSAGGFHWKYK